MSSRRAARAAVKVVRWRRRECGGMRVLRICEVDFSLGRGVEEGLGGGLFEGGMGRRRAVRRESWECRRWRV